MPSPLKLVVDVTVCIPSIPPRAALLTRALQSVFDQTVQPVMTNVHVDTDRLGAAINRDLTVGVADTEWLAFLDDDDELLPQHLEKLLACAKKTGADLVFPWFTVVGGTDPFPQWEELAWDDAAPRQVPITFLVKTAAYREVGGFSYEWDSSQGTDPGVDSDGNRAGEDYRFALRLVTAGKKIVHLNTRTWLWHHDSGNTSGLASRW